MNKGDLIKAVQSRTFKAAAPEIVNATFEIMAEGLAAGNDVAIAGFGTFKAKLRQAKTGRNPRTGETIEIPQKMTVTFTPGKALREGMNG
ncbi:MAG: HU family DNA-binding protein [Desulfovibrionaceae bacterium]